jgi:hypothetical protein
LANGEKLERRLQEMIMEHKGWGKLSKNECSGYNNSMEKIL